MQPSGGGVSGTWRRAPTRSMPNRSIADACQSVARTFKVSSLVALRRMFDIGRLDWAAYQRAYGEELDRVTRLVEERKAGGGNFYNTQPVRVSKRLARALIASTLEGQTLYRDAFRMLGLTSNLLSMSWPAGLVACRWPIFWTPMCSSKPRTCTTDSTSARRSGTGSRRRTKELRSSASRKWRMSWLAWVMTSHNGLSE